MANNIELAQRFAPLLDEIYKIEALTSTLDADPQFVQATRNANTVLLPEMEVQGLGDYSRSSGYVGGDVDLKWTAYQLTQDRGRSFQVDAMDDEESIEIAFGRLVGEFMRTRVIPEIDAYRFATMAAKAANAVDGDLDAETAVAAIDEATVTLDDAEVPREGRVLYVSATVAKYLRNSDNYVRNVDVRTRGGVDRRVDQFDGMTVIQVPKSRFYNEIELLDGSSAGQEDGGYEPAASALAINFMIVHPSAVLAVTKHALPRIFDPTTNQSANAWKFDYRIYHDLFVPTNKTDGIYVHTEADGA